MKTYIKHNRFLVSVCVNILSGIFVLMQTILFQGCSSNNCPLERTVTCNYQFYDSDGQTISYLDTITVTTLLPGHKTKYVYKRPNYLTITSEVQRNDLITSGYTETIIQSRRDTILANKCYGRSSIKIPMSFSNEADTLIFNYSSISRNDTIIVKHKSFTFVDLPECGSYQFHELNNVTSTDAAINHIEIYNPKVNYDGNENIKIYFNGIAE